MNEWNGTVWYGCCDCCDTSLAISVLFSNIPILSWATNERRHGMALVIAGGHCLSQIRLFECNLLNQNQDMFALQAFREITVKSRSSTTGFPSVSFFVPLCHTISTCIGESPSEIFAVDGAVSGYTNAPARLARRNSCFISLTSCDISRC